MVAGGAPQQKKDMLPVVCDVVVRTPTFANVISVYPHDNTPFRKVVLHNQIDGLFSAVEQREKALKDDDANESPMPRLGIDDGMGFKIAVIGDSTIRVRGRHYDHNLG